MLGPDNRTQDFDFTDSAPEAQSPSSEVDYRSAWA